MNNLQNKIKDKIFLVTSELNPPKGTDLSTLFNKVELLKKSITAFNITDNHTSKMSMSPIAVANLLKTQGIEPIVQLACRDKNRVALLCMTGDHSSIGDDPNSKPVFDLDGISLLKAVSSLRNGKDLANNKLKGAPEIFSGAVANPGSNDIQKEIDRMKQKIEAGAQFFQTQPVYDIKKFESFFNQTKELKEARLKINTKIKRINVEVTDLKIFHEKSQDRLFDNNQMTRFQFTDLRIHFPQI